MEISNAQSTLSSNPSCSTKTAQFFTLIQPNLISQLPNKLLNNSQLFIQRVFNASKKPYPIKQPCIIVENYSFLEFLPSIFSLFNFYDLYEILG